MNIRLNLSTAARTLGLGLLFVGFGQLQAADWPRFRGPNADGVAADNPGLPTTWTTTDNVKWVAELPGWGWSCPIVWGDRVFLSTVVSDEKNLTPNKGLYLGKGVRDPAKGIHHWIVYCFDLETGKRLWAHEAHSGRPKVPRHPKSTYAAETATTDGERLYVLFGDLGLYCYDFDGRPLWSRPIEPRRTFQDYGAAASPVVHDGQVIVVYDNLESSWIAAFAADTGDERWRRARDETHSWATPLVWQNELRTEIVVPGKNRNRSYSLDGKLLWEFDGKMSNLVIPSPFAAHGVCYIASGYIGDAHRPTFAIKPGATGDITPSGGFADSEFISWYQGTSSSYNPSQIVYGDYLYTLYDRGFLTCHDARTGVEIYGKRRFSPRGSFTSSPWAYNGHLFFLSEDGLTYAVKAGPEFEIVARSQLDELCLASPAVAGDKLLIRTASKLYCMTDGAKLNGAAAEPAEHETQTTLVNRVGTADGELDQLQRKLDAEGIEFRTADIISEGTRMAAEVFSPKNARRKLPTILMSHGWGGTAEALRPDGIAFSKAGFLVVTFDYRGWGNSDARLIAKKKPLQKDGKLFAEVVELRGVVDPIDQTTDIMNAIHWVQGEPLCDHERIGIWGSSFSGGHVVYVAARDPRVKAFVSQVGAMDARWAIENPQLRRHVFQQGTARTRGQIGYPRPFAEFNGMRGQPVWEKLMRYAPIEDLGRCGDVAKLFIIAENEELFDNNDHAIAAYERATGIKKLVTVKGIKHYGIYREKRKAAQQLAIDWFAEHLGNPAVKIPKEKDPSIEVKTKVHRLSTTNRAVYDAFVYVNRVPEKPEEGETAEDLAGRIFGRLANQEGRILLKVPPGMNQQAYLGFKTFLRHDGTASAGNCATCHTPPLFTDLKSHVVAEGGSAKPTPSLRNLTKRSVDLGKVLIDKILSSRRKRSGGADEIDAAYKAMHISEADIPNLLAFLRLLEDGSDKGFRKLILDARVLDTSEQ